MMQKISRAKAQNIKVSFNPSFNFSFPYFSFSLFITKATTKTFRYIAMSGVLQKFQWFNALTSLRLKQEINQLFFVSI